MCVCVCVCVRVCVSTGIEGYTQKRAMSLYRSLLVVALDGHRNCFSITVVLIIDMYILIRVHFDNLPYLHLSSFPFLSRKGRHLVEVQAHGRGLHSFLGGKGMQISPYHAPAHFLLQLDITKQNYSIDMATIVPDSIAQCASKPSWDVNLSKLQALSPQQTK